MNRIWYCKIGEAEVLQHPGDEIMRNAVTKAYKEVTGEEPVFIFSGWGAKLTEPERAVVEDRLPRDDERSLDKDGWPVRWSDSTYLGDGPWGA